MWTDASVKIACFKLFQHVNRSALSQATGFLFSGFDTNKLKERLYQARRQGFASETRFFVHRQAMDIYRHKKALWRQMQMNAIQCLLAYFVASIFETKRDQGMEALCLWHASFLAQVIIIGHGQSMNTFLGLKLIGRLRWKQGWSEVGDDCGETCHFTVHASWSVGKEYWPGHGGRGSKGFEPMNRWTMNQGEP